MTTDTPSLSELVRHGCSVDGCNWPTCGCDPQVFATDVAAIMSRCSSVGVGEEDVEPPASGLEVSEWVLHAASEAYLQHDGQVDMIGLEAALKVAIHHGCFCPHCNPTRHHHSAAALRAALKRIFALQAQRVAQAAPPNPQPIKGERSFRLREFGMTEEEAKTKWCPFVRHYNALFQPCGNSLASMPPRETPAPAFTCIGSACMAWRWDGQEAETLEYLGMGQTPKGDGWVCTLAEKGRENFTIKSAWRRLNPDRIGFCGLAGKL